jgi:23S rRNA (uracil-5-)-methyltransferase RumA
LNTHNPCPVYKKCGGCQLQNLDYQRQLEWKQGRCIKLLGGFGRVQPIIGMKNPYHYRNKVQAAFGKDRNGRIISGVYQSSTHRIIPINSCQTEDKKADELIVHIRELMKSFKLSVYDEITGKGFLRHVLVKRGFSTGEIMVVLVTGTPVFTAKKNFVRVLLEKHPEITTVVQNINNQHTSMVLGKRENVLYGKGYITDILCGCRFRISAQSFYQINPVQTEVLYGTAMEFAKLKKTDRVFDAYCGIGTIGIIAAKEAGDVIGVEVNKEAVHDAIVNARENKIKNIYFYAADAGEFMTAMAEEGEKVDVVFMDPPRAGSDAKFLNSLITLAPERVVYISCNPETLARDLTVLQRNKYKIEKIQPVDMFPHTNHVECVVLMSRKDG